MCTLLEGANPSGKIGDYAGETFWNELLSIEKQGELAIQTHFALAGLYRKLGKTSETEREIQEFHKLRQTTPRHQLRLERCQENQLRVNVQSALEPQYYPVEG